MGTRAGIKGSRTGKGLTEGAEKSTHRERNDGSMEKRKCPQKEEVGRNGRNYVISHPGIHFVSCNFSAFHDRFESELAQESVNCKA